jgi:hypothetical protein
MLSCVPLYVGHCSNTPRSISHSCCLDRAKHGIVAARQEKMHEYELQIEAKVQQYEMQMQSNLQEYQANMVAQNSELTECHKEIDDLTGTVSSLHDALKVHCCFHCGQHASVFCLSQLYLFCDCGTFMCWSSTESPIRT